MTTIRALSVAGALVALAAVEARPAAAEIYRPWCVQYYGRSGGTTCTFDSYAQCMETARGAGAYCYQNPWYLESHAPVTDVPRKSRVPVADVPWENPDMAAERPRVPRKKRPAADPGPQPVFR
jgi:hypothetical protein